MLLVGTFFSTQAVELKLTSGVLDSTIASTIERNASVFLSEVNLACVNNRALNLTGIACDKDFETDINMLWDNDAQVWVATSNDVPGLVMEAEDFDELVKRVEDAIPELLELNDNCKY